MEVEINALDYEGRGVAKANGKVIFVTGALPNETAKIEITHDKKRFTEGRVTAIVRPSPARVTPRCQYVPQCGGCVLQHLDAQAQIAAKEHIFREQMTRLGKITLPPLAPALTGDDWHYRRRARLSWHEKTGALGFVARGSHRVINIDHCAILPPEISARLPDIRALCRRGTGIEEIDISAGEAVTVLHLRGEMPRNDKWRAACDEFITFANQHSTLPWQIWLTTGKGKNAQCEKIPATAPRLDYSLPAFDLRLPFRPDDFTQVNWRVNRLMTQTAVAALALQPDEPVVDLFCGLGNFSLPLARAGGKVWGIEGVHEMVQRARDNAAAHGLGERCTFQRADLFTVGKKDLQRWGKIAKWLLDPPRAGAQTLCASLQKPFLPQKIVYVSCNPATLARDSQLLGAHGFRISSARIINMFPQTAHIESMVVFTR